MSEEEEKIKQIIEGKIKNDETFVGSTTDEDFLNLNDETYKKFNVMKDAQNIDSEIERIDKDNFLALKQKVEDKEVHFYAFLNKEFNILNRKFLNCSMKCYDNPEVFSYFNNFNRNRRCSRQKNVLKCVNRESLKRKFLLKDRIK